MLWTQGPSLSEPRASAACVLAGNTFIAWGGSNGQRTVDGTPILYDLSTNQYVISYTPPSSYASNTDVLGNNPNNKNTNDNSNRSGRINSNSLPDDDSGPNSMLIIAAVIGAIVAVAVAALISVYVRKRRRIEYEAHLEQMECGGVFNGGNGGSGNYSRRQSTSTFNKPAPKDGYSFDEDKDDLAKPTKAHTQDSYARRNSNQL